MATTDMFTGAETIGLGVQKKAENEFLSIIIINYRDGRKVSHAHPTVFLSADEAEQWARKAVVPILEMMENLGLASVLVDGSAEPDPDRPTGLQCTQWERVDGKKVYCKAPATWHADLSKYHAPDEFCCDTHIEEFRTLGPTAVSVVRRIN